MKILIIRMSSFGDVILTTPVLRQLREKYPDATIDFIVLDKFKEAIRCNEDIDKLIIFEKNKFRGIFGIYAFTKELGQYDLIIDLHSKLRSIFISTFTKGRVLRYKKRSILQSLLVKWKLIKYRAPQTIVKSYFKPLNDIGLSYRGEELKFDFEAKDLGIVNEYNNFIVFAPGASKETKKWTKENFSHLGKLLHEKYKKEVLLIGGKNEFHDLEDIRKNMGLFCKNLAGELSLKESGALLSKADFVVTNDSGPFHMARGVKTQSFVIFGPTDPNMFEYDENAVLLYGNEECSPCSLHGDKECPKGHFNCMKNLTAEKVSKIIYSHKEKKCIF